MMSENIVAIGNHLWQSTLFAGVVAMLALLLRKNRAAVRYRLWLAASLKFLLPFSLLTGMGKYIEWPADRLQTPVALVTAVEGFSKPLSVDTVAVPRQTSTYSSTSQSGLENAPADSSPIGLTILLSVWIGGVAVVLLLWLREWARMRASLNAASPVDTDLPIPVLMTAMPTEPGIVGIVRPLLLLPKGLIDRLSEEQLDAVLTHELCHVRRRDNLMAAIHMAVEALFWFHPMIWWIEKRLVEERERACDEEVIGRGGEPQAYAEGILNVCKFYKESALACVSGVAGADLKRRIEDIMGNRVAHKLSWSRTALLTVLGVMVLAGPIAVGVVQATQSRESVAYTFSSIDIPGSSLTTATGIDISGRVVGFYTDGGGTHGFLFNSGTLSSIDVPGAGWTAAFGISSNGQIVGGFGQTDAPTGRHGFLWSGGSFSTFDVPGSMDTVARGVNNRGQIVGEYTGTDGTRHGFRLSGGNYDTIEIPESRTGTANGINDSGQIVGGSGSGSLATGFLLNSTSYSRIAFPNSNYTEVFGVNNIGDVVGQIDGAQAPFRGFRHSGGEYTVVALSDSPTSWNARGVNDLGEIVGAVTGRDGKTRGFQATPATLRRTPLDPAMTMSITNALGGNTPAVAPAATGPVGPAGPAGPPGPAGPRGPASVPTAQEQAMAHPARALNAARGSLERASSALKTAIANNIGQRGRGGSPADAPLEKARAAIAAAVDDIAGATAFVDEHPEIANVTFRLNINRESSIQVDRPSLQVALNNISAAADALRQIPGDLGGFRTKFNANMDTAIELIVATDRISVAGRGGAARGESPGVEGQ